MDLILTGRGVDGAEAERIGLVNRVVAPGAALAAAVELAARAGRAAAALHAQRPAVGARAVGPVRGRRRCATRSAAAGRRSPAARRSPARPASPPGAGRHGATAAPPAEHPVTAPADEGGERPAAPSVCDRCGAVCDDGDTRAGRRPPPFGGDVGHPDGDVLPAPQGGDPPLAAQPGQPHGAHHVRLEPSPRGRSAGAGPCGSSSSAAVTCRRSGPCARGSCCTPSPPTSALRNAKQLRKVTMVDDTWTSTSTSGGRTSTTSSTGCGPSRECARSRSTVGSGGPMQPGRRNCRPDRLSRHGRSTRCRRTGPPGRPRDVPAVLRPAMRGSFHRASSRCRRADRRAGGRASPAGPGRRHRLRGLRHRDAGRQRHLPLPPAVPPRAPAAAPARPHDDPRRPPRARTRPSSCWPRRHDPRRAARRGVGRSCVVGAAIRMLWLDAPSGLVALVYLVAGWQIVLDLPAYLAALTRRRAGAAGRRRRLLQPRGGRLRAQAARTRGRPCSATTRCSTRSSCSARCATGSPCSSLTG